jgi:hypothetical protein
MALLAVLLSHRIFLTHDSMISYTHAWWIEHRLWGGDGIPWRMPVLGHGQALTFPYGFLPWTVAALLWPLLGQWSVTLVLALGAVGLIAATFWAFPELRRPNGGWWAAAVLVNPILVLAPLSGQLPFLWGAALFVTAIGCWRRGHRAWAVVLGGLGQLCHAAVVLPIAAIVVLARLRWEPHRRALLACWALSALIAAPAIWPVVSSPVFTDSSLATKAVQFVGTVGIRSGVIAAPIVAVLAVRHARRWVAPVVFCVMLVLNVALLAPLDASYSWAALRRQPDQTMQRFTRTAEFRPGATYRLLRSSDGKIGMYQLLRAGARLDSEFFPESMWYGHFADARAYSAFLAARHVDAVIVFRRLAPTNATNEGALLAGMSGQPCRDGTVGVRLVAAHDGWDDYAIDRSCLSGSTTPSSPGGGGSR